MTLQPDVERRINELMSRENLSFKEAINKVLRAGLEEVDAERPPQAPFRVKAFAGGLKPGYDWTRVSQLADELEDAERVEKLGLVK